MAQPIQGMNSYPREALGLASAARGNQGMLRTSAPEIDNAMDNGPESKPGVNPQPFNNMNMEMRNMQQNIMSASPQAQANAVQQVRNDRRLASQQEFDAITFREQYKGAVASQLPSTALNTMADPTVAADVSKAIAQTKMQEPFANASMNPQFQAGTNSNSLPMSGAYPGM